MTLAPLPTTDVSGVEAAVYLERGCQHGHDLDDWLQAEREREPRG
jgi:DUF2934 family protein